MTVAELRRKGFRVQVTHLRRIKKSPGVLVEKYQCNNKDILDPKGGCTQVTLTTPEGRKLSGSVNCYWRDAYCRKTGVQYAIEDALKKQ